jgi:hypothetical protein
MPSCYCDVSVMFSESETHTWQSTVRKNKNSVSHQTVPLMCCICFTATAATKSYIGIYFITGQKWKRRNYSKYNRYQKCCVCKLYDQSNYVTYITATYTRTKRRWHGALRMPRRENDTTQSGQNDGQKPLSPKCCPRELPAGLTRVAWLPPCTSFWTFHKVFVAILCIENTIENKANVLINKETLLCRMLAVRLLSPKLAPSHPRRVSQGMWCPKETYSYGKIPLRPEFVFMAG